MSIWTATREGHISLSAIADFIVKSGWDYVDRRNVRKTLEKPPEEVKELLNEQVIDARYLKDCTPPLKGLLEMTFKAFMNWWETTHPQSTQSRAERARKFGDLA
jgi:hypothetical protein